MWSSKHAIPHALRPTLDGTADDNFGDAEDEGPCKGRDPVDHRALTTRMTLRHDVGVPRKILVPIIWASEPDLEVTEL